MNYLSLCCVVKDETSYLREWVNYHTLIGVEQFLIYDNGSRVSVRETLREEVANGRAVVIDIPWPRPQAVAYAHCLRYLGRSARWIAFIDMDEFIVPKVNADLRAFLEAYEAYGGLGVYWKMFGSSGHKEKPAGSQLQNFWLATDETYDANRLFKSIVQAAYGCYPIGAHTFLYRGERYLVNENGEQIYNSQTPPRAAEKIQLNHYYLRSEREFKDKIARGNALTAIEPHKMEEFRRIDGAATVEDRHILALVSELAADWPSPASLPLPGREAPAAPVAPPLDEATFSYFEQDTLAGLVQEARAAGDWLLVHNLLRVAGWHFHEAAWLWQAKWFFESYLAMCDVLTAAGQYPAAIELLEPAAAALPASPAIWGRLGLNRCYHGQPAQAEAAYRQAVALAPQDADWLVSLARLYFDQRRYSEAASHLQRVTEIKPDDVDSWVGLALASQALADWPACAAAYRRAEVLQPAHPALPALRQRLMERGCLSQRAHPAQG